MELTKKTLGYLEGWSSIVINNILFFLKLWCGLRIGSVAMTADAWHTLSDSLTSLVVIIGFWQAARPADRKHSFGHGRAEPIGSLIIGVILAVVGFNFLKDSIGRLLLHQAAEFELIGIIVFGASAVLKEALAQFSLWASRKTASRSLKADAWHHRSDAIASFLIVIGALFCRYVWWIDGVMGIGVSLLILYATYSIMRNTVSYLLGESVSQRLEDKIHVTIKNAEVEVERLHHLHLHDYGDHIELTAHLRVYRDMQVDEAHALASRIEKILKEQLKIEATIHIEPGDKDSSS